MPSLPSFSTLLFFKSKKRLLAIVLILIAFLAGFLVALSFTNRKSSQSRPVVSDILKETPAEEEKITEIEIEEVSVSAEDIPIPQGEKIGGYIQHQLLDLNGDKVKELIAIFHDKGTDGLYRVSFAIYKAEKGSWKMYLRQELEGFTLWTRDKDTFPTEVGKSMNSYDLADVTGDKLLDVLVKTRAEGSGRFFGTFVFGVKDDKLDKLLVLGPIPQGSAGIEGYKVWALAPEYGPDDPNCCPSFWIKTWWQWKGSEFKQLGERQGDDFYNLEKTKYSSQKETETGEGFIQGGLSYPSDYIPPDMKVCAKNLKTLKSYCTDKHIYDKNKYKYGVGYKLKVPVGSYYVSATTKALEGKPAYYTEFVTCGLNINCQSHKKIKVEVKSGKTVNDVNPWDWY